jgi:hypothetical protein
MSVLAVSVRGSPIESPTERTDLMAQSSRPDSKGVAAPGPGAPVVIDCDDCAVRGPGCRDCVVSVLLGVPQTLLQDERAALEVLADVGLAPRLRLVPIRRDRGSGVA